VVPGIAVEGSGASSRRLRLAEPGQADGDHPQAGDGRGGIEATLELDPCGCRQGAVVVELGGLTAHVLAEGREKVRSEPLLVSLASEFLALRFGQEGGSVGL
jgi:hypothetical protein